MEKYLLYEIVGQIVVVATLLPFVLFFPRGTFNMRLVVFAAFYSVVTQFVGFFLLPTTDRMGNFLSDYANLVGYAHSRGRVAVFVWPFQSRIRQIRELPHFVWIEGEHGKTTRNTKMTCYAHESSSSPLWTSLETMHSLLKTEKEKEKNHCTVHLRLDDLFTQNLHQYTLSRARWYRKQLHNCTEVLIVTRVLDQIGQKIVESLKTSLNRTVYLYSNGTISDDFARLASASFLVGSGSTFSFWAGVANGNAVLPRTGLLACRDDCGVKLVEADSMNAQRVSDWMQRGEHEKILADFLAGIY